MNQWLMQFREETRASIADPFWLCLAEAIAAVESGWGRGAIRTAEGLNEIGYKALAGRPAVERATREADAAGALQPQRQRFRLFADRREQAEALRWLLRGSAYYDSARLLFVLAFYAGYAPGRDEGARALVRVFNEIARSGSHEGVRPLRLAKPGALDEGARTLNMQAFDRTVALFRKICA